MSSLDDIITIIELSLRKSLSCGIAFRPDQGLEGIWVNPAEKHRVMRKN